MAAGKALAADFHRRILPKQTSLTPCLFTQCLLMSQVTFLRLCSLALSWQMTRFGIFRFVSGEESIWSEITNPFSASPNNTHPELGYV